MMRSQAQPTAVPAEIFRLTSLLEAPGAVTTRLYRSRNTGIPVQDHAEQVVDAHLVRKEGAEDEEDLQLVVL
jgi:hypothetical protein